MPPPPAPPSSTARSSCPPPPASPPPRTTVADAGASHRHRQRRNRRRRPTALTALNGRRLDPRTARIARIGGQRPVDLNADRLRDTVICRYHLPKIPSTALSVAISGHSIGSWEARKASIAVARHSAARLRLIHCRIGSRVGDLAVQLRLIGHRSSVRARRRRRPENCRCASSNTGSSNQALRGLAKANCSCSDTRDPLSANGRESPCTRLRVRNGPSTSCRTIASDGCRRLRGGEAGAERP